jgi:hypothetical protein
VSSVFVVVGSEKDLTLADATADPIELVSPARQERYEATLQFEPRKDKEGNLYWNKVLDRQRGATARVEAEVAPLAIELDGALFDELPDLAVLVLASFKDGNRAMRLLTAQQFEEVGEFVLELYGQELKQQ